MEPTGQEKIGKQQEILVKAWHYSPVFDVGQTHSLFRLSLNRMNGLLCENSQHDSSSQNRLSVCQPLSRPFCKSSEKSCAVSIIIPPWNGRKGASQVAQWERLCLPKQETQVRSLGWEDPRENEVAAQFSILAREIPWTEETGGLQSMRSQELDTT